MAYQYLFRSLGRSTFRSLDRPPFRSPDRSPFRCHDRSPFRSLDRSPFRCHDRSPWHCPSFIMRLYEGQSLDEQCDPLVCWVCQLPKPRNKKIGPRWVPPLWPMYERRRLARGLTANLHSRFPHGPRCCIGGQVCIQERFQLSDQLEVPIKVALQNCRPEATETRPDAIPESAGRGLGTGRACTRGEDAREEHVHRKKA